MREILQKSVTKLLRPLARLLLRHGISHAEFSDWAKQAFVLEAEKSFGVGGKKPTGSRIAIVTGINRKEVKRIQELPEQVNTTSSKFNRAARVVSGWLQDSDFHDKAGKPRPLEYGEANKEFNLLVKRHSGDVPARALLDELVRVGTVERTNDGKVSLKRHAYIPHESKEDMLTILGESSTDLLETLDHNIASPSDQSRLQLSVVYDNISTESLLKFKDLSREKGTSLLQELDQFLASQDRDITKAENGEGRHRVGLGLYLIEGDLQVDNNDNE